jgi:hypothetical protein
MRTDNYYSNLERVPPKHDTSDLPDQIAKFLAKGGKVQQVPMGVTKFGEKPLSEIAIKQGRIDRFGDKPKSAKT